MKNDWSIGKKIGALSALMLALLLTISLIAWWQMRSLVNGYHDGVLREKTVEVKSLELGQALLQVRRREKDFIARKETAYADSVQKYLDQVDRETREVRAFASAEVAGDFEALAQKSKAYRAEFGALKALEETRGLTENDGLQSQFRNAVHAFSDAIEKLPVQDGLALSLTLRKHEKDYMLRDDLKYVDKNRETARILGDRILASALPASEKLRLAGLLKEYQSGFDALVDKDGEIKKALTAVKIAADEGLTLSDKITDTERERVAILEKKITASARLSMTIIWVALAVVFISGILLSTLITRSISGPIRQLVQAAEKLAKGDLNQNISIKSRDEVGALAGAFVTMKNNVSRVISETQNLVEKAAQGELDRRAETAQFEGSWRELTGGINRLLDAIVTPIQEAMTVMSAASRRNLKKRVEGDYRGQFSEFKTNINSAIAALDGALSQVQDSVEQVASASGQISSGSQTLSQGAQEQASSLEEVSSSLEEISSMTKQNAENANQAKALAARARKSAESGNVSMEKMAAAIERIKKSSDETAQIVKTIDEIAFQTNLLALNAAVEAARAGDAGRGFAVVAEEVRNLAGRSAEAAKNTAGMIQESVKNSENGVSLSVEVAKFLKEIMEGSQKVNDLVAEISAASDEQSKGIGQVSTAVSQMNQLTQQNAANSEESASAAQELSSQAQSLQSMVADFELTGGAAAGRARSQAAPRLTFLHANAPKTAAPAAAPEAVPAAGARGNSHGNGKARRFRNLEAELPLETAAVEGF